MTILVRFSVVTFIDRKTKVSVLGSVPELGSWIESNRVELAESDAEFRLEPALEPSFWYKDVRISFNGKQSLSFEYKFVIEKHGFIEWEGEGPAHNRKEVLTVSDKQTSELLVDGVYILPVGIWIEKTGHLSEFEYTTRFYCHVEREQILHPSKIFDNIWVGSCPRLRYHIFELKSHGITAVMNLQTVEDIRRSCSGLYKYNHDFPGALRKIYKEEGLSYIWTPLEDMSSEARIIHLPQIVYLLDGLIKNGHKVYVHCNGGVGRSVAAVCGYMMYVLQWKMAKVQFHMFSKRPVSYIDSKALVTAHSDFDHKFGNIRNVVINSN